MRTTFVYAQRLFRGDPGKASARLVAAPRGNRLPAGEGHAMTAGFHANATLFAVCSGPSLMPRRLLRGSDVYHNMQLYTSQGSPVRTNIDIDDTLMAEAQEASGHATKKQTVEQALRLMIRLRRQQEASAAFGKYRWRGNLARSRKGRGIS
jgi:Arc/MetJ family transcription regulator